MKPKWKRPLAFLLSAAMTISLSGTPIYATADEDTPVNGLCRHHPEHTQDCGYTEATPCNHEHDEDCYTLVKNCIHEHDAGCYPEVEESVSGSGTEPSSQEKTEPTECSHVCSEETGCITEELNCRHEHDADCGYTEAAPCTFICEECTGASDNEEDNQPEEKCICETLCKEDSINADCPVCGTEEADLSACSGVEETDSPECICEILCKEDSINADCPVCGTEEADLSACRGKAEQTDRKRIVSWEWADADEFLTDGILLLPDISEEKPAAFEEVVSRLPEKITAVMETEQEPVEITLTGWSCEAFGDSQTEGAFVFTAELPEEYTLAENAVPLEVEVRLGLEKVMVVSASNAVVRVDIGGTVNEYDDIQTAFESVGSGQTATITLLDNVELSEETQLTVSGTVTLASSESYTISGSSVDGNGLINVETGGCLTIQSDTITIKNTTTSYGSCVRVNGGKLGVNGGTIQSKNNDIRVINGIGIDNGTAEINGGTILSESLSNYQSYGIYANTSASVKITAGTIKGSDYGCVLTSPDSSLTGGTFTGNSCAISRGGMDYNVGELLADGYVYYNGEKAEGPPAFGKNETAKELPSGTFTVGRCNEHSVTSGTDTGSGKHTGKCDYCNSEVSEDHTFGTNKECSVCGAQAAVSVKIGGETTYYGTIENAWSAARGSTATVTLLSDVTASSALTVSGNDDITLTSEMKDGGSDTYTLKGNSSSVINISGGSLTLKKGSVAGSGGYPSSGIQITGGSFYMEDGSVFNCCMALDIENGEVYISGGSLSGDNTTFGGWGINATGGRIELTGGSYSGDPLSIINYGRNGDYLYDIPVSNLLGEGYAFKQGDTWVKDTVVNTDNGLTGTVTVEKAPIQNVSISTDKDTITYGGTAPTLTAGIKLAENVSENDVTYQWYQDGTAITGATSKTYTPGKLDANEDGYQFTCTATADGYSLTSAEAAVVVERASIKDAVVTLSGNKFEYDGREFALAWASVVLNGTALNVGTDFTFSGDTGTDAKIYTFTAKGQGNYTGTATAEWEITPKELTVTGLTMEKVYDGTADVTIDTANAVLNGVYDGDDVALDTSGVAARFESANAGEDKAVSYDGTFVLSGGAASNYTLTQPVSLTGTISKRQITVTPDADQKIEYGQSMPVLTYTITGDGLVSEDDISGTLHCSAATGAVGRYEITRGTLTATENYDLTFTDGVMFEITRPALTDADVTVTLPDGGYTYDSTAKEPEIAVVRNGVTVDASEYTVSYSNSNGGAGDHTNAGTVTVTITAKEDGNYEGSNSQASFEIERTDISNASAELVNSLTYSGKEQVQNVTVTMKGADLTEGTDYIVSGSTGTNAGDYTLTITGAGNYIGEAKKDFTIAKARVTVSSVNVTGRTYEQGSLNVEGTVTFNGEGVLNAIRHNIVAAMDNDNAGNSKNVTVTVTVTDPDYQLCTANGTPIDSWTGTTTVEITKADAGVSMSVESITGSGDTRTVTLSAAPTPDNATGNVTFLQGGTEIGEATIGSDGIARYQWQTDTDTACTLTARYSGDNNYNPAESTEVTVDTSRKPQQITIADVGAKTYGDNAFSLSVTGGSGTGAVTFTSSDPDVLSIDGGTTAIRGVGTVTITAAKAADDQYNEASAAYQLTIGKKSLTVTADDQSVVAGKSMPELTYRVTGLVNNDTFTAPVLETTAADTNTTGAYDIIISGGALTHADCYDVVYRNGTLTVSECLYAVRVSASGSGTATASLEQAAAGAAITLNVTADSGHHFVRWEVTAGGVTITNNSFIMPESDVEIRAVFAGNSSGSSSDNSSEENSSDDSSKENSSGNDAISPAAQTDTAVPAIGKAAPVAPDANGGVFVGNSVVSSAIKTARQEAEQNSAGKNSVAVVVPVISTVGQTGFAVTIEAPALDTLVKESVQWFEVQIAGHTSAMFDEDTLEWLDIVTGGKDIILRSNEIIDTGSLSAQARDAIGVRPVYDFDLVYVSGGIEMPITSLNGHAITIRIDYALTGDESAGSLYAVYVDDNGAVEWLTKSSYDSDRQTMIFEASHFNIYGVGYKTPVPAFDDIEDHWAKEHIEFVVSRGLLSGTGSNQFSPDTGMTWGMFATALGRLAGIDTDSYRYGMYMDAAADASYAPYVNWAAQAGIVSGTNVSVFSPDSDITREQMAVILKNYADKLGYETPAVLETVTFADNSYISSWAGEAVTALQQAGIISFKSQNLFDPQGTATRAESAAVLHRFVEAVIDRQTANGWQVNDSGERYYYKDGKPVTGWLFNGQKWYWMDTGGRMLSGGWDIS